MATNVAVIVDAQTGQPLMVVVPDFDVQLKDPSFNPPGSQQILVPLATYNISTADQLQAIVATAVVSLGITPTTAVGA
jgi:hypothetical protein